MSEPTAICNNCGTPSYEEPPMVCFNCQTMKQKPAEKLIRPVKCHFCDQPMYYAGDERHEPEVCVNLNSITGEVPEHHFYTHIRCWNERMAKPIATHNK